MIANVLLATMAIANPPIEMEIDYAASLSTQAHEMRLTPMERDRIWREAMLAVKKMNYYMNRAEIEASRIKNIDIRDATVGAIEGAITGLSGRSPYAVVIGGCLGALARIGGGAYLHFAKSCDYVREAKIYGAIADDLQEKLWRD